MLIWGQFPGTSPRGLILWSDVQCARKDNFPWKLLSVKWVNNFTQVQLNWNQDYFCDSSFGFFQSVRCSIRWTKVTETLGTRLAIFRIWMEGYKCLLKAFQVALYFSSLVFLSTQTFLLSRVQLPWLQRSVVEIPRSSVKKNHLLSLWKLSEWSLTVFSRISAHALIKCEVTFLHF